MFGKNKKNKKIEEENKITDQIVVHTMQDDLDLNIEKNNAEDGNDIAENISSLKKDSPFSGGNSSIMKNNLSTSLKTENTAKAENAFPVRNDIRPVSAEEKPPIKKPFPENMGNGIKRPFINNNEKPAQHKETAMSEVFAPKAPIREKSYSMPKTVSNITVDVEKENNFLDESNKLISSVNKSKEEDGVEEKITLQKKQNTERSNKKNVFAYVVSGALVVLLGVAGYFAWNSYYFKDINVNPVAEEPVVAVEEPVTEVNEFSELVNFLTVSPEKNSKEGLKALIDETFAMMENSQFKLLEFILVDESNNPLTFASFIDTMGINLSELDMNNLSSEFSLYLYKNDMDEKISLSIKTTDTEAIKSDMKKKETSLVAVMSPLFPEDVMEESLKKNIFNDSLYNNIDIRYINLDEGTSVDYAVVTDYLMIATSKDSGRAIIDKILLENTDLEDETITSEKTKDIFSENSQDSQKLEAGETVIVP